MARGFYQTINMIARETRHASQEKERAQRRLMKELELQGRLENKNSKRSYVEGQLAKTEVLNALLAEELEQLGTILVRSLAHDPYIKFTDFLQHPTENELGEEFSAHLVTEPQREKFLPEHPSLFALLIPGTKKRYGARLKEAECLFEDAFKKFEEFNTRRLAALAALHQNANIHNQTMRDAEEALEKNDPEAIRNYFELVLSLAEDPAKFPKKLRVAFVPESKQLAFDYQLPTLENSIPEVEKYRYIKSTDKISEIKRGERARQLLYTNVISQIALRCLHQVFTADKLRQIDVVALNAYIATIDSRTGRPVQPYVISVRTTRVAYPVVPGSTKCGIAA